MTPAQQRTLDDLTRDLDLLVYRLEVEHPDDLDAARADRARIRRELERMRDQLEELVRALGG